jgi:hypothetical protein
MGRVAGDACASAGPLLAGCPGFPTRLLAIIISMSLYNPALATYRLEHTPKHRIARTLSARSIGQQASIAILTALGGLLADITSPRTALTVIGLLILASPLLLPRSGGPAPVGGLEMATAGAGPQQPFPSSTPAKP